MANNTDFLRFSAYSIKDLITQKLSQDSKFTDQIYEGSNLAILIDIFSYMAQCMLYALNNAAAESMFADTQIYENINRLVKFIGYNPKGYQTSNVIFTFDNSNAQNDITIPKYSYINTDKTDANGYAVYYSTITDENIPRSIPNPEILFYNGKWEKYSTVFKSSGEAYQKFILDGLQSDTLNNKNIPWKMINVYVENIIDNSILEYKCVTSGLFTDNNIENGTYIYSNNDSNAIFNLRLNENKIYEIQFGNGITGRIPPENSNIHILYLKSNGLDENVKLISEELTFKTLKYDNPLGTLTITNNQNINIGEYVANQFKDKYFKNITNSSEPVAEEDVESIRRNAPEWFKTGNRLVTSEDYKYYIRNRFYDNIIDIECQNNWNYIATFYKWLYDLGMNGNFIRYGYTRQKSGQYYINQHRLIKYDYKYSDNTDSNNVYLWIKMRNDSDIYKKVILTEIENIKMLTQEVVILKPLIVNFSPCAAYIDEAIEKYFSDNIGFDANYDSYIEVTVDNNILYSDTDIKTKVANIIRQFFNETKCQLGQFVDFSELCRQIYTQAAVKKIRTVYKTAETEHILNGISFASWTSEYIDKGDDLDISTQSKTLEIFQFPALYDAVNIENRIKVIRKQINLINVNPY